MPYPPQFSPYILDVEASGFGSDSYPIEVGLALEEGARFCSLITPAKDWLHWDDSAESVHHISRQVLQDHGKPVQAVAHELNRLLHGKFVFSDGWVVDEPWIIRLFTEARMEMRFTIYDLQTILTEAQMDVWHEVKAVVADELNLERHRASNDAFVIQETFRRSSGVVSPTLVQSL